jgi:hypothetical protein
VMANPAHRFHLGAFVDYVGWAARDPQMVENFERDTGIKCRPPKTGLDAVIDKATGRNSAIASQFIDWCATYYGREFLPTNFMEILTEKRDDNA